mgnify:CR=1 FL=1
MFCKNCGKELNKRGQSLSQLRYKSFLPHFNHKHFQLQGKFLGQRDEYERLLFITHTRRHQRNDATKFWHQLQLKKILFIRDTSFWNSRDQGLVLTDGGVYCIPDNDKPDEKIVLPWSVIQRVEYKDLVLYFWGYGDETDYCPIHIHIS